MADSSSNEDLLMPHINRILTSREYPKTMCPSEVPRALTTSELGAIGVSNWRDLMPEVRQILWNMSQRGEVEILQKGSPLPNDVPLDKIKGPIRARKTHWDHSVLTSGRPVLLDDNWKWKGFLQNDGSILFLWLLYAGRRALLWSSFPGSRGLVHHDFSSNMFKHCPSSRIFISYQNNIIDLKLSLVKRHR